MNRELEIEVLVPHPVVRGLGGEYLEHGLPVDKDGKVTVEMRWVACRVVSENEDGTLNLEVVVGWSHINNATEGTEMRQWRRRGELSRDVAQGVRGAFRDLADSTDPVIAMVARIVKPGTRRAAMISAANVAADEARSPSVRRDATIALAIGAALEGIVDD